MRTVEIPHFDLPFRFEAGRAVVNEQDSDADIATCVEAIVRYRKGFRDIAPHFGIEDLAFAQGPLDGSHLMADIEDQEPRVTTQLIDAEDDLDQAQSLSEGIDIIRIALGVPDAG